MAETVTMRPPPQPSLKARSKNMGSSDLVQDIGLFPGTFISPLWRDMPSIFQQPKERLRMEWLWIRFAFGNFLA